MENGEKKKNLSNGTSWFIWGGAFGILAITSRNTIAFIVFGILCGLLIFMGLNKRKAFDEMYLPEDPDESTQEITTPTVLLDEVKDEIIPEAKIDDPNVPDDEKNDLDSKNSN